MLVRNDFSSKKAKEKRRTFGKVSMIISALVFCDETESETGTIGWRRKKNIDFCFIQPSC